MTAIPVIFAVWIGVALWPSTQDFETLKHHGVRATGWVTDRYERYWKGGHGLFASYQFALPDGSWIKGDDSLHMVNRKTNYMGPTVPVLYDPARPTLSKLDLDGRVSSYDNSINLWEIALLEAIPVIWIIIVAISGVTTYRNAKRAWEERPTKGDL